jgi:hypothetical protein
MASFSADNSPMRAMSAQGIWSSQVNWCPGSALSASPISMRRTGGRRESGRHPDRHPADARRSPDRGSDVHEFVGGRLCWKAHRVPLVVLSHALPGWVGWHQVDAGFQQSTRARHIAVLGSPGGAIGKVEVNCLLLDQDREVALRRRAAHPETSGNLGGSQRRR